MNKKNISHLGILTLGVLIALSVFSSCLGGYMVGVALTPKGHENDLEKHHAKWEKRVPGIMTWYDSLRAEGIIKDTTIIGLDGYRLHAVYASAIDPENAQGTAMLSHGYTDDHLCMMHIARMYRDSLNFNIFAVDHHFHGLSEGRAIQMGWLDRINLEKWYEVAHGIWDNDFMIVHGVSMGGACAMMASGDPSPDYVKAFVDDCGYTSVWNQFAKQLKEDYHLPVFPILNSANAICRRKYNWDFKEASSVAQLAKSTKPVLFIHGEKDTYVPTSEVYKNYDAKVNGYKQLWVAPGSIHACSYQDHPKEYRETVASFIEVARAQ